MQFREDDSRIRKGHGAQNWARRLPPLGTQCPKTRYDTQGRTENQIQSLQAGTTNTF